MADKGNGDDKISQEDCPFCNGTGQMPLEEAATGPFPSADLFSDRPDPPQSVTLIYHAIHQVFVKVPGHVERVEATRRAIKIAREHMATLPAGHKLRQACPQWHVNDYGDGLHAGGHWIVKCVSIRESEESNLGWEDLLDLDSVSSINTAAFVGLGSD